MRCSRAERHPPAEPSRSRDSLEGAFRGSDVLDHVAIGVKERGRGQSASIRTGRGGCRSH